jgi:hypothetical protein
MRGLAVTLTIYARCVHARIVECICLGLHDVNVLNAWHKRTTTLDIGMHTLQMRSLRIVQQKLQKNAML